MEVRAESPPLVVIKKMAIKEGLKFIWDLAVRHGTKWALRALRKLGIASGWGAIILFVVTALLEIKFKQFANQLA